MQELYRFLMAAHTSEPCSHPPIPIPWICIFEAFAARPPKFVNRLLEATNLR
jgi:hypothetical protein